MGGFLASRQPLHGLRMRRECIILAAALFEAGSAHGQDPRALLHEYKCYICHDDTETKAGPAYADVSAAYRDNPNAVQMVARVIKQGQHGGGPWHMPPHPEVSDAEARAMARYILSLPAGVSSPSSSVDGGQGAIQPAQVR
jgi:cytochrome c